nr:MAG TPA: hypothetical protein [Caudoviricetes sp.]
MFKFHRKGNDNISSSERIALFYFSLYIFMRCFLYVNKEKKC